MQQAKIQTTTPYQASMRGQQLGSLNSASMVFQQGMKRGSALAGLQAKVNTGVRGKKGTHRSSMSIKVTGGRELMPSVDIEGNFLFNVASENAVAYDFEPVANGKSLGIGRAVENPNRHGNDIISIQTLQKLLAGEVVVKENGMSINDTKITVDDVMSGIDPLGPSISSTAHPEQLRQFGDLKRSKIDDRTRNYAPDSAMRCVNYWGHVTPGELCGFIIKREERSFMTENHLDNYRDSLEENAVRFAPHENLWRHPFQIFPYHGTTRPAPWDLWYGFDYELEVQVGERIEEEEEEEEERDEGEEEDEDDDGIVFDAGRAPRERTVRKTMQSFGGTPFIAGTGMFIPVGIFEYATSGASKNFASAISNMSEALHVGMCQLKGWKSMKI